MHVLVTGGTGFLGARLCERLIQGGHTLTVLTRAPQRQPARSGQTFVAWDDPAWQEGLDRCQAVIHLAGEPLVGRRWTPQQKLVLRESRVATTQRLIDAMEASHARPPVLLSASAVGYYGPRDDEPLTEASRAGTGFLAELCQAWEGEALRAETLGVRVVRLRIGIVLGPGGGALTKMVPPFRWFLGGPLGSGRQWMSWIHREDVTSLMEWAMTRPSVRGILNATAPNPVTMQEFCRALGRAMRRPSWAPVPAALLRALLGEVADVLLTGQRVLPEAATRGGYRFRYPDVTAALRACLGPDAS